MSKDMSNKFLVILSIAVGIIVVPFILGSMFFSYILKTTENQIVVAVINPKANIEEVKEEILQLPHVKKVLIDYRDEQWADIEDAESLGMGVRSKDQVKIKVDKQKNLKKVFEKVSEKEYVEKVNYFPDTEFFDGVGRAFMVDK